ncbi:conserved unknown protein [Ectocarpus siliculosus]|uniref:Uncharacterized protein n=1 Tax=Ectocarpus siliculosus TaxID=2880 RepID=D8LTC3_ECTSI|nr:conserved unknown protein [Ectocarpus siliculosus]|eukprot:CBN77994.1 conserved unknown protein [Ectocarpus siliculosus]
MAPMMTSLRCVAQRPAQGCSLLRRKWVLLSRGLSSAGTGGDSGGGGDGADFGVRVWGHGTKGQLGIESEKLPNKETLMGRLGREKATSTPTPLPGFEASGARTVSCGSEFTALVTTEGKLLTVGTNSKKGLLGLGIVDGRNRHKMTEVPALKGVDVVSVACGEQHSVAVDSEGVAYSWGSGGSRWDGAGALGLGNLEDEKFLVSSPTEITTLSGVGAKVDKVSAGGSHTAFLTTDGEVWTCGRGEYGLCGNGGTEDQLTPAPLEAFEEHIIVDVQAGHAFALALTSEGEVLGWGRNDQGQLGLGGGLTMDVYAAEVLPRTIDALVDEKVVSIGAGYNHASAVTESGKLYMWGMKRSLEPEWMSALDGQRVVYAACGKWYTSAITDTGALYTIGSGGTYCLGNGTGGKSQTRNQPESVKPLSRVEVAHITCGASHTAALIRPRPREG